MVLGNQTFLLYLPTCQLGGFVEEAQNGGLAHCRNELVPLVGVEDVQLDCAVCIEPAQVPRTVTIPVEELESVSARFELWWEG